MPGFPEWLLWGAPEWSTVVLWIAVGLSALVIWNYARQTAVWWARLLGAALKLTAIGLLAICVLQPMVRAKRPKPQANVLPTLIDNSLSMQLAAETAAETRGERLVKALDPSKSWRIRLAQDFDVRDYQFDSRLNTLEDADSLLFDGMESSLQASLQSLSERFASRPVGGVVLMSDGNATDVDADQDWSKLGFPVYPIVTGDETALDDLRITGISLRQTNFESAPITVRVQGECTGTPPSAIHAKLVDASDGSVLEEQSRVIDATKDSLDFRFQFRPAKKGIGFFHVCLFAEDDRQAVLTSLSKSDTPSTDADPDETKPKSVWEPTLANNQRLIAVDRERGPYRVLYVSGRPNWDFKFLRRSIQEDSEIQLVGLLRIANKEPKFTFRDSRLNETNPLYAGMGEKTEETAEQYDEPVILRLGVKESEELSEGFPETAEELFAYHGVILDDIETSFFTADQLLLLRQFVSSRGGGLLLLGGQESFAQRDFQNTPLGELSPVYGPRTDGPSDEIPAARTGRMQITREGWLEPWLRLRSNEETEQDRLVGMPQFNSINEVGALKPGATRLLALKTADGEELPALVTQRFGKGKTAAIPVGDMWRWSMRRDTAENDDPAQAWRQLLRWLVGDVPRRVEVDLQRQSGAAAPVQIHIVARDENYLPLDNAEVQVTVSKQGSDPIIVSAEPVRDQSGAYVADFWASEPGGYFANVRVHAIDGTPVGETETGWAVELAAEEFRELGTNRDLLERIASQSGGEVIELKDLDAFASDLPNRKMPVLETWVYPLWHMPWVMTLVLACLCSEWALRRWKGMA